MLWLYDDVIKWNNFTAVPGEFPSQRLETRSFDVCFDLRLNKRLSKQSWGWWFETLSSPLWRHSNERFTHQHCTVMIHIFKWLTYPYKSSDHQSTRICEKVYHPVRERWITSISNEFEITLHLLASQLLYIMISLAIDYDVIGRS